MSCYLALIHKDPDSDLSVSFPDFPGCVTAGGTLEEAEDMAEEALRGHIQVMREHGEEVPKPGARWGALAPTVRGFYVFVDDLRHCEDRYGATWPFERCKAPHCNGRRNIIGFSVPDEIWSAVVPRGLNVVCLACFDEMAQARGIKYRHVLEVFPPVTWEDIY